jgi:hypothetical protein
MIRIRDQQIRTDWIKRIERITENGKTVCRIWFRVGPVGVSTYTGADAEAALRLLVDHPALQV